MKSESLTGSNATYALKSGAVARSLLVSTALGSCTALLLALAPHAASALDLDGPQTYSADIGGAQDVTINSGSVVFTGMNTYSGSTEIRNGATLSLAGQGRVNASSGILIDGTFDISSAASAFAKTISGNGTIYTGTSLDPKTLHITAGTGEYAGNITGAGGLILMGGSLRLTGDLTTTGQVATSSGTSLTIGNGGSSGSLTGNLLNYGSTTFDRNDALTYSGVMTGPGDITFTGGGTFTITGNNSNTGLTTIDALTTVRLGNGGTTGNFGGGNVNFGAILNNGTLVFDRSDTVAYRGVLSGNGTFEKASFSELSLNGTSTATGLFTVGNGILFIGRSTGFAAASYAGSISVGYNSSGGSLAVLAGYGTIGGDVTIRDRGMIAGGSELQTGTLTIEGDLTFQQGGGLAVLVNAGNDTSSIVHVNGTANLAGAVGHTTTLGSTVGFGPLKTYTILTADGGLNGRFEGVTSHLAFLDAELGYTTNDVTLTLIRNDIKFSEVALTPNQFAAARAVEEMGTSSAIYRAAIPLTQEQANAGFDSISGEVHASASSAMIAAGDQFRDVMTRRLGGADRATGVTASSKGTGTTRAAAGWQGWVDAYGARSDLDATANAAGISGSYGGLALGGDLRLENGWLVGGALGLGKSGFDRDGKTASVDSTDLQIGVYGERSWGAVTLRTGASIASHDVKSDRLVQIGVVSERVEGRYDARTVQAFGELGYKVAMPRGVLEPYINLARVHYSADAFTETGGTTALNVAVEDRSNTFATLGLRTSHGFSLKGTPATFEGGVSWRRAFGDLAGSTTNSFSGGTSFLVSGANLPRDLMSLDAGIGFDLSSGSALKIGYSGQFGDGLRQDSLRASFRMSF